MTNFLPGDYIIKVHQNLLLGSVIGRIVGELAQLVFPNSNISVPGVYALIGAAAQLGAWTRTMMAVVVTLIEITGDVGMTIPLIVAVIIARSLSTMVAHHSYTHHLFYELVDAVHTDAKKRAIEIMKGNYADSGDPKTLTNRINERKTKTQLQQNQDFTVKDINEVIEDLRKPGY